MYIPIFILYQILATSCTTCLSSVNMNKEIKIIMLTDLDTLEISFDFHEGSRQLYAEMTRVFLINNVMRMRDCPNIKRSVFYHLHLSTLQYEYYKICPKSQGISYD
jgi:hypothetical protein